MQPRVTAILVAHNGEEHLGRTLAALAAQTRPVDATALVDVESSDGTAALLDAVDGAVRVDAKGRAFGDGARAAVRALPPSDSADDWIWLLAADTAPEPGALAALLGAVEVAPSVAIAGPKVVDRDDHALLLEYGVTMTSLGTSVALVDRELDQAQFDRDDDVLGVGATGMLVRRHVWERLEGLDRGLPSTDSGLDLSVRARLAGHRVVRVPGARVSRVHPPQDFGRRRPATTATRRRLARRAQLHRRFAYAPGAALPIHWLSLVPLALLRSIGHLLGKRPSAVGGEFAAAFAAAFAPRGVGAARRRIHRDRELGWAAVAPLRLGGSALRERRSSLRERAEEARAGEAPLVRAEFFGGGGIWAVLVAAAVGAGLFWWLIGASAVQGGALLPLSDTLPELWRNAVGGWREIGLGTAGPADPFAVLLALLGSITFWSPSVSIVALWILALPLAALGAWWCATRISRRAWPPAVAALLWAFAPPLLVALGDGRIGAVIAHLVLPWLVLAGIEGRRSWSAAATAGLLMAVTAAAAPSLLPALLVAWFAWLVAHPRALHRLIAIPLPTIAVFAPLALSQLGRGTPLALLADPGVVLRYAASSGWGLSLLEPREGANGWEAIAQAVGLGHVYGQVLIAALLAPLAATALAALFLRGSQRAIPALAVALLGLLTAVAAAHLTLVADGADPVAVWPGAGLSLYWMGLVAAGAIALQALDRLGVLAGVIVLACGALAVGPLGIGLALRQVPAQAGTGQTLPAAVGAQADSTPRIATLLITPLADGTASAELVRGGGATLDRQSTWVSTRPTLSADERRLADLAGNLSSRSGLDPRDELRELGVVYVVVPRADDDASPEQAAVRSRITEALDGTAALTPVGAGQTRSGDSLWRFPAAEVDEIPAAPAAPLDPVLTTAQLIVLGATMLLAIPTRRRRRVVSETGLPGEDPADTFAEDEDA
ncbi:glycosyltransferase family 2 protein [Schumannella sp. 10F1B-5-1]|uniref:glycosyltransferase family 2 protein n=1 Tax=Schumannella sp. 10F1B-5-1 TaxID=2590780 RepID=UPI0011311C04|nr:glycosyltransferase family 2 protein [Schumannella sp. 10F1B-5-1]TPW73573.1 glycosyltransferase family 2 protein [Schumannella sp. 10F1B-5-1]